MSRNRNGGVSTRTVNREWGRKARKREDTQRNLNNAARVEAVNEGLAEIEEENAA